MIELLDQERCVPCGACLDVCPMDVFRTADDGSYLVAFPDDCMACYTCVIDCPKDAITVGPERRARVQAW